MGLLDGPIIEGVKALTDGAGNIIGKVLEGTTTKKEALLELERLRLAGEHELVERANTVTNAKARIIEAELVQGDAYTKRARPTVIYVGLAYIGLACIVYPAILAIVGTEVDMLPLPMEFWVAWGGIVGTYSIGRSVEKRGGEGKIDRAAQWITGTKKQRRQIAALEEAL